MSLALSIFFGLVAGSIAAAFAGPPGFVIGGILGAMLGLLIPTGRKTPPRLSQGQSAAPRVTISVSSHSYDAPKSKYAAKPSRLRWIAPGEVITVGGFQISSGLFYVSEGRSSTEDASAIDIKLPIGRPASGPNSQLGYYSQYCYLSADQRATYLEWLAAGRKDEDPASRDVGCIFLFFYGLERRFLIDTDVGQEIVAEIVTLLQRYSPYTRSRSLQTYCCQLIHFWGWKQGADYYAKLWEWIETLPVSLLGEDELQFVLASYCQRSQGLPVNLAYMIAARDPDSRQSVVVKRVNEEFRDLFAKRYAEQFPQGLLLKAAKRDARIQYHAASPSLLRLQYDRPDPFGLSIPNVLGVQSQFKPLSAIWNSCIEALADYSRAKAKQKQGASDLKVHLALPEELRTTADHPLEEQWRQLLQRAQGVDDCFLIETSEVAQLISLPSRKKLTTVQSRELAQTIESLGFALEPDARYTGIAYGWDQQIAVFSPVGKTVIAPTPACIGAAVLLELCVLIAGADGQLHQSELEVIREFIEKQIPSNPHDHQRLLALERLLTNDVSEARNSLTRIAKRVTSDKRELIAEVLVYIAGADDIITKDELRALNRIFKAFELPNEKLQSLLQAVRRQLGEVTIQSASPTAVGEPIPQRPVAVPGIQIDMSRVAQISQETREVIAILSKVMIEDEPFDTDSTVLRADAKGVPDPSNGIPLESALMNQTPAWIQSLDQRYQNITLSLIERPTWKRTDFDALARQYYLMPLSVYDTLNEWADQHLGDFLLEGDDPVVIHKNLVPNTNTST